MKLIIFWAADKAGAGGGGGGVGDSWKYLMGLCSPVLQILTLYQTKKIVIFHTSS